LDQPFPSSAQISPQAPPIYGARSKAMTKSQLVCTANDATKAGKCLTFPQMIQTCTTWSGTNIKQDTHIGIQQWCKGSEKPSVRVKLFGVLFLETENDLNRDASFV
jgi:hypothetical protein